MAIDFASEQVFPLSEAPDYIHRRRGRKAAVSTLYRWATSGVRGVQLEVLQVGGCRCTSLAALQRFFERLATNNLSPAPAKTCVNSAVEAELDREGL